jgi:hypothetical protein
MAHVSEDYGAAPPYAAAVRAHEGPAAAPRRDHSMLSEGALGAAWQANAKGDADKAIVWGSPA